MLPKSKLPAPLMTEDQIRQWHDEGFEIGSHTYNHVYLSQQSPEVQHDELVRSKNYLEQLLGAPVASSCYHYGDIDAPAIEGVKLAGYKWAEATHKGIARTEDKMWELRQLSNI